MSAPFSPALALYLGAARLAGPPARLLLRRRLAAGREDAARLSERMGRPGLPRPPGALIWLHGASVGEGTVALALAVRLRAAAPDCPVLLTTGTVTAAAALQGRLPPGMQHQYAPLDAWPFVTRFMAHWRPAVAARVDSEIWPATLVAARRAGARLALVNGRISARSAARWARFAPGMARALLGRVALLAAQDADSAARFAALGTPATALRVGGALKAAAPAPAADPAALAAMRAAMAGRPVWAAVSTHEGEEAAALDAAAVWAAQGGAAPLTLLVPRHPDRGPQVAALARARGLRAARRAAGEDPAGADVYVADTLGEMGLWLRLAPAVFIGGSLAARGGHNPYEPAALGALILHGPHVANFADAYAALARAGGAVAVDDAAALGPALTAAMTPAGGLTAAAQAAAQAGAAALAADAGPMDDAVAGLLALLPEGG